MSKRILGTLLVATAIGIVAVAPSGYRPPSSDGAPPRTAERNAGQLQATPREGRASGSAGTTAQRLEAQKKIAPGTFRALGPKAYEIIRPNAFRPPGDALAHVGQLKARASAGDANAAYEIYLTVDECRTFTSERADELARSAAIVGSEGGFLQRSERLLEECESLVLAGNIDAADWLSRAAAMGSQDAMRGYAASPETVFGSLEDGIRDPGTLIQWRETAVGYLEDLAAQGNLSALGDLERAHASGRFGDPDPFRAWAYARVIQRIDPRLVTDQDLARYRNVLSREQQASADSLADSLYRRCCSPE